MNSAADETVDVLIVGAGPTGLMCALLLARLGIASVVLERNPVTDEHPKAHELNARSVEILREVGIGEEDLAREASPVEDGSRVLFCRCINEEIGRIDLMSDPARREKYKTHLRQTLPYFNLSQSEFEKLLIAKARTSPLIDLRFGHLWEASDEAADGIVSRIGGEASYRVVSRYLLGCDGASSRVRRGIGIEMDGPAEIQTFVNAYFRLDLRDRIQTPAKLFWILHPQHAGTLIAHHIERRWVYAVPIYEPWQSPEDFTPEVLRARIQGALGFKVPGLEIVSTSTWRMTAQVAQRFRSGRAFLVGDAAHRFPPTGGLGMNTGIADAHNLCWKLAAVLRGAAGDALLDTYETERRPVAQRNCEESQRNFEKVFEVIEALGLSRDAPKLLARIMGSRAMRMLPGAIRNGLHRAIAVPAEILIRGARRPGRARDRMLAAIADQVGHFDRLGLDIGYRYEIGALVPDNGPPAPDPGGVSDYVPSCAPGARLPHAWIAVDGKRRSTHDLIGFEKFTLLTGPAKRSWADAARTAAQAFGITLETIIVDDPEWTRLSGVSGGCALLVRPDGHIAWRANDVEAIDTDVLNGVLLRVLSRENGNATDIVPPIAGTRGVDS